MAKTWLSIRVDLLSGAHTGELWPTPGRVLIVGPSHFHGSSHLSGVVLAALDC